MKGSIKSAIVFGVLTAGATVLVKKCNTTRLMCYAHNAMALVCDKLCDLTDSLGDMVDERIAAEAAEEAMNDMTGYATAKVCQDSPKDTKPTAQDADKCDDTNGTAEKEYFADIKEEAVPDDKEAAEYLNDVDDADTEDTDDCESLFDADDTEK